MTTEQKIMEVLTENSAGMGTIIQKVKDRYPDTTAQQIASTLTALAKTGKISQRHSRIHLYSLKKVGVPVWYVVHDEEGFWLTETPTGGDTVFVAENRIDAEIELGRLITSGC